ncbi:MAG: sensor histidine kinase [Nocardioidaceae bacterium]
MKVWKHPVAQFLAAGLVVLALLVLAVTFFGRREATDEATKDARDMTEVLAKSVAEPAIPVGLVEGSAGAADKFDREMRRRLLIGRVLRVKIWDASGWIVYSDKTQLMGERFDLDAEELDVLKHGGTNAEVSDLTAEENRFEAGEGKLLEVYTQISAPTGEPLLFEAYFSYDDVTRRSEAIQRSFGPLTIAGLLAFLVVTTPIVWVLARRLGAASRERERLLRAAVDASDAERRRIARDLHDTVVQDLAGTSFALAATSRDLADRPATAERLTGLAGSVRSSLRSLRSLLVEIYPADLHAEGLGAALSDLVAPAAGQGIRTTVEVEEPIAASDSAVRLVWRVAQEAVRNALRHGRPSAVSVRVVATGDMLTLEVTDDGVGFVPEQVPTGGHFGLRGLRDLIEESGGHLDVTSAPGAGTRVRLEVRAR